MKLRIQKRREFLDLTKTPCATGEFYYEYEELEIEMFRWGRNHQFEYVVKNGSFYRKLNDDEEIVGLGI